MAQSRNSNTIQRRRRCDSEIRRPAGPDFSGHQAIQVLLLRSIRLACLSRGGFSAAFLLQCLVAIEANAVRLHEAAYTRRIDASGRCGFNFASTCGRYSGKSWSDFLYVAK
jgi:hypothetical protein